MLGKRLQRACTAPIFHTEFEKQKHNCKKSEGFLKGLYFLNLGALLAGMIVVSIRQESGYYQCHSITVNFGDAVWDPAFALNTTSGVYEDWILVFSYFNGVYVKDRIQENVVRASKPVYRETRKFDWEAVSSGGSEIVLRSCVIILLASRCHFFSMKLESQLRLSIAMKSVLG